MEQKGFENKTAKLLDDFQLTPSPSVWENVAQRIQKRKRRRFLFWILPSLLLIGGGILVTVQPPAPEREQTAVREGLYKSTNGTVQPNKLPDMTAAVDIPQVEAGSSSGSGAAENAAGRSNGFAPSQHQTGPRLFRFKDNRYGEPGHATNPNNRPATNTIVGASRDSIAWLADLGDEPAAIIPTPAAAAPSAAENKTPAVQQATAQSSPDPILKSPAAERPDRSKKPVLTTFIAPGLAILQDPVPGGSLGPAFEAGLLMKTPSKKASLQLSYGLTLGVYNTDRFKVPAADLLQSGSSMIGSTPGSSLANDPAADRGGNSLVLVNLPLDLQLPIGRKGGRPTDLFVGITPGYLLGSGLSFPDAVSGTAAPDLSRHRRFQSSVQAGVNLGMLSKIGYPMTIGVGYRQGMTGLWKKNTGLDQRLSGLQLRMTWRVGAHRTTVK